MSGVRVSGVRAVAGLTGITGITGVLGIAGVLRVGLVPVAVALDRLLAVVAATLGVGVLVVLAVQALALGGLELLLEVGDGLLHLLQQVAFDLAGARDLIVDLGGVSTDVVEELVLEPLHITHRHV